MQCAIVQRFPIEGSMVEPILSNANSVSGTVNREKPQSKQKRTLGEYQESGFVEILPAGEVDHHLSRQFRLIARRALRTKHNPTSDDN